MLLMSGLISLPIFARVTCGGSSPAPDTSILSSGGRLTDVVTQDQDGLNICYANSLAYSLQARLGHQVSAHQLAISAGMDAAQSALGGNGSGSGRITAVTGRSTDATHDVRGVFVDNNSACAAFNAVKARGGRVCPRQDLENTLTPAGSNPDDQGRVIKALSNLYDRFSTLKANNPAAAGQFRQAVMDMLQQGQGTSAAECQRLRREGVPKDFTDKITDSCDSAHTRLMTTLTELGRKRAALPTAPEVAPTVAEGETPAPTRASLQAEIDALEIKATIERAKIRQMGTIPTDPDLTGQTGSGGISSTCQLKPSVVTAIRQQYLLPLGAAMATESGAFNTSGSSMNVAYDAVSHIFTPIPQEVATAPNRSVFPDSILSMSVRARATEASMRDRLRSDLRLVVPAYCAEDASYLNLQNPNNIRLFINNNYHFCPTTEFGSAAAEAFKSVAVLKKENLPISDILRAVADLDKRADDYMMGVIGADCANVTTNKLEALTCDETVLPTRLTAAEREGKTPAEIYTLKKLKSQRKMAQMAQDHLAKGNPLMLAICTNFLKNPNSDSRFRERCEATGPHGRHIITAVGYRCRHGKIEYQLLNSWGNQCESYRPAGPNDPPPLYDCDENNGTIWVPENVLIKNTSAISAVNPPPATFGKEDATP